MSINTDTETAAAPTLEVLDKPDALHELNQTKIRLASAEAEVAALQHTAAALREHIKTLEKNSFFFALSNVDAGQVLQDAGTQLQGLCAVVRKRESKGRIVLGITVKPFKGDAQDVMRQALADLRAEISEATGVAILTGKPTGI